MLRTTEQWTRRKEPFTSCGRNPQAPPGRAEAPFLKHCTHCYSRVENIFLLDSFVYIAPGINSQRDSLCTREYEMGAPQQFFTWLLSHGRLLESTHKTHKVWAESKWVFKLLWGEKRLYLMCRRFYMSNNHNCRAIPENKGCKPSDGPPVGV